MDSSLASGTSVRRTSPPELHAVLSRPVLMAHLVNVLADLVETCRFGSQIKTLQLLLNSSSWQTMERTGFRWRRSTVRTVPFPTIPIVTNSPPPYHLVSQVILVEILLNNAKAFSQYSFRARQASSFAVQLKYLSRIFHSVADSDYGT